MTRRPALLQYFVLALLLHTSTLFGADMDLQRFWEIVGSARAGTSSLEDRVDQLRRELARLTPEEIRAFHETYAEQSERAYTWELWGAAYVMNGGCSDDCFDYFRDWLISEGQSVFEAALQDPDSLSELSAVEAPELELYRYVADEVYEEKCSRKLVAQKAQRSADPAGEEWSEEEVYSLYPKLAGKYQ